jgi:uncharacterized membrane protein
MSTAMSLFEGSPNLSFNERAMSVVIGLGLAAAGVTPRPNPLLNVAALVGGGYLAYRGMTGYCPVKAAIADGGGHDRIAGSGQSMTANSF